MRFRWVLAVSLALNVFLAAFIGVQAWRLHHVRGAMVAESLFKQIAERLPSEDRAILRRAFLVRAPSLMAAGARSREAMEQVRADIDHVPYDDAKLRADLEAAREPRQRMGQLVEEILLESLPKLSDQGRKVIGEYRLGAR